MKLFDKWLKDSKEWDKKYGVTTGIFKIMSDSNTKYLEKENQNLKAQLEVITKVFKEAMDRLSQYNTHKYWVEDELKKIQEIGK